MKTRITRSLKSLLAGLTIAQLALLPTPSHASVDGARARAYSLLHRLEAVGYEVRDTFTRGLLSEGQSTLCRTTLVAGTSYKIVASGCEDAYDVDVAVYDENGNLVSRDNDSSAVAVAEVTPAWTGQFTIKVTMYDSTRDGAHFVLLYAFE